MKQHIKKEAIIIWVLTFGARNIVIRVYFLSGLKSDIHSVVVVVVVVVAAVVVVVVGVCVCVCACVRA